MSRRRREASRAGSLTPAVRILLVGVAGFLGIFLLAGALELVLTRDRIHHGVCVGGLDVGGMTAGQAAGALRGRFAPALRRPAELRHRAQRWSLRPEGFAVAIDYAATVRRAERVGRTGSLVSDTAARIAAWFRPCSVELAASLNEDALSDFLSGVSQSVARPAVNASLRVDGTRVVRTRARRGLALRPAAARRTVLHAITSDGLRTAELPVRAVPVEIDDAAVAVAYSDAKSMVARPLGLKYEKSSWLIKPAEVGSWIVFARQLVPATPARPRVVLKSLLSRPAVERAITKMPRAKTIPARDAQFRIVGEQVRIIPSRTGRGIDTDKAYRSISRAVRRRGPRRVRLVTGLVQPRLTTRWARSTGIKRLLGTYTTNYDPGQESRVANIHLLLGHLNNTFVRPGGVFSVNRTIGPRTAEKGYREAPAIEGGKLVPSLGGGVCQVGTTLFNAVFFSGLDVVERHNHSFYISHYPDGRDATVSWGGPDLRFRNDTPSWVLIKAWWGDDWVTISLYGADVDNEVTYETGEFSNFVEPPVEKIEDPELPAGEIVVEDDGIRGRDITVWRTVRRAGRVVHKDSFESRYEPKASVVRVGTKRKPGPSKEPTAQPRP